MLGLSLQIDKLSRCPVSTSTAKSDLSLTILLLAHCSTTWVSKLKMSPSNSTALFYPEKPTRPHHGREWPHRGQEWPALAHREQECPAWPHRTSPGPGPRARDQSTRAPGLGQYWTRPRGPGPIWTQGLGSTGPGPRAREQSPGKGAMASDLIYLTSSPPWGLGPQGGIGV